MNQVKRLELKYFFPSSEKITTIDLLSALMIPDPNNHNDLGYKITSLYFDTLHDNDLNEKLDGVIYREKYRLRFYNNSTNSGKFEIKRKLNNCIEKISVNLNAKEIHRICHSDFTVLEKFPETAYVSARMKYLCYSPKCIVSYNRMAFYLPINNIRVTIDSDLSTYGFETDITKIGLLTPIPIQKKGYEILEIKYENHLPSYIKNSLESKTCIRSSISKYSLSRLENNTEIYGDDPVIPF
jgi:hypothetical protein